MTKRQLLYSSTSIIKHQIINNMDLSNNVSLIGFFGKDPQVINNEKGKEMCTFSLATHYHKKDEGGNKQQLTEWHNCIAFGGAAVLISKYMTAKSKAALNGSLRTRNYEDKQGVVKYVTEIVVDRILFMDNKAEGNG